MVVLRRRTPGFQPRDGAFGLRSETSRTSLTAALTCLNTCSVDKAKGPAFQLGRQQEGEVMNRNFGALMAAIILGALGDNANAAVRGWYLSAGLGQARYSGIDAQAITQPGWTGSATDSSSAYRVVGGFDFTADWGMEFGYVDFGHAEADTQSPSRPVPDMATYYDTRFDAKGWTLAALGRLPLSSRWSLYGRVGAVDAQVQFQATTDGFVNLPPISTATAWDASGGVGVSWEFQRRWSVALGWDQYRQMGDSTTGKHNVNLFSLQLTYRFFDD